MKILLASANSGKIIELKEILAGIGIEIVTLAGSEATGWIETGSSFEENALLKARHYYQRSGLATIADDSGLEVYSLDGAPGIHSARYGGSQASDANRIGKLLKGLDGVPLERRGAAFVCVAAIVSADGEHTFRGEVLGSILTEPRGQGGFGYDPVFLYEPLGKTFAELSPTEKAEVSHRGSAFRQLARWLVESGLLDSPSPGDRI